MRKGIALAEFCRRTLFTTDKHVLCRMWSACKNEYLWKSGPRLAKSIAAVAPQGLRSPLKCSSNDSTQSARSSIKNEANGHVMRTMCSRVKKLKIHRGKIDEGCILLLKLYMAWNVVLLMTPLYDKGKEKNFVLKRSRNREKIVCMWLKNRNEVKKS